MIIDVSKWQGKIDWKTVKEKNPDLTGVFIKASEGVGYTDPNLRYNALEATKYGIPVGYYHFASLNDHNEVADAYSEAKYFLSVIAGLPGGLPVVLDIEKNNAQLDKTEVLNYINSFFAALKTAGISDYVLYSYTPFLDVNLPANHGLGNIKLWIAAYTKTLKLPKGWSKEWLWQYTQSGKVAGITGNVDLNKKPV